jgi:hypothetical protein
VNCCRLDSRCFDGPSPNQQRADRIEAFAEQLALPRAALEGNPHAAPPLQSDEFGRFLRIGDHGAFIGVTGNRAGILPAPKGVAQTFVFAAAMQMAGR